MRPVSPSGIASIDPWTNLTLRGSAPASNTTLVADPEVEGFGPYREIVFGLAINGLSFQGGSGPTAMLEAWIQRQTPDGVWDDVMAFQTDMYSVSTTFPIYYVGAFTALATASGVPQQVQDCALTIGFGQSSSWCSDLLRVKHRVTVAGDPASVSMTWSLLARAR